MEQPGENRYLLKFVLVSSLSFFIGTVHGVLQMIPFIRSWLDSIGSPYGGPGHMIDPLAHAHINSDWRGHDTEHGRHLLLAAQILQ